MITYAKIALLVLRLLESFVDQWVKKGYVSEGERKQILAQLDRIRERVSVAREENSAVDKMNSEELREEADKWAK